MLKSIARGLHRTPAGDSSHVRFRAAVGLFSGGCGASLGRAGAAAPRQERGGQSPRLDGLLRGAALLARLHTLGVGAQPGLRQSGAMPPVSFQHFLRKVRPGALGRLALAATAGHNRSAHTDSQQQEAASRRLLCAGGLQR